jgi:hypothetical protein
MELFEVSRALSRVRLGVEGIPGPKLVANRLAKKVKRLFATAGAGEVVPVNKAWFWAMKSADAAYCWQYVVPDASAAVAA